VRYLLEYITNLASQDFAKKVGIRGSNSCILFEYDENRPICVLCRHTMPKLLHKCDKIILLLRDYKACVESQIVRMRKCGHGAYKKQIKHYCKNIRDYHKITCEKHIVYYEQLFDNPLSVVRKLSEFYELNVDAEKLEDLKNNIKTHVKKSLDIYKRIQQKVLTGNNKDNPHNLNISRIKQLNRMVLNFLPRSMLHYIKCYL